MLVISESTSYRITYFEDVNAISLEWKYLYTGNEYKKVMEILLEEAIKHKNCNVIIKMPQIFSKNSDDLKWESNYFFPNLEMHEIMNVYYVLSENNDRLRCSLVMNSGMIRFYIKSDVNQILQELPVSEGENAVVNNEQYVPGDQSIVSSMGNEKTAKKGNKTIKIVCIVIAALVIVVILGFAAIAGIGMLIIRMIGEMG